jgi:hypothetical protein
LGEKLPARATHRPEGARENNRSAIAAAASGKTLWVARSAGKMKRSAGFRFLAVDKAARVTMMSDGLIGLNELVSMRSSLP